MSIEEQNSVTPETDISSELTQQVVDAAMAIGDSLDKVDEKDRTALLQAAAKQLETHGATVFDLHEIISQRAELDPDALPGKIGRTGSTRAQVLGRLAYNRINLGRRR